MQRLFLKRKKGFTLIELLVTIAVIGLLSLVIGGIVLSFVEKSEKESNKVTYTNIKNAAFSYANEFNNWNIDLEDNSEYICTTIRYLINKGFLKNSDIFTDENGIEISKDTTLKVSRDSNKVIDNSIELGSSKCDMSKPVLEIDIEGSLINFNEEEWYNEEPKIVLNTKVIGAREIEGYIFYFNDIQKNVTTSEKTSSLNVSEITGDISQKDAEVCGIVINNNGIPSEKVCETINIDVTTPSNPVLTSSDNINSNNWHKNSFDLNITGGGSSPSGIYYEYVVDSEGGTKINSNKISNITSVNDTYKVKTCNNAGKCSSESTYIAKVDTEKPEIISFVSDSLDSNVTSLNITARFKDTLSGTIKYKITTESEYVNSNWINVDATTNELTHSLNITENNTYYIWVEDRAGNYNWGFIDVNNVDSFEPTPPVLTASDNIKSGSWHKNIFNLNITGGENESNNVTYKYVINNSSIEHEVSNNKISNISSENDTYKVKACSKSGKCSTYTSYLAKVDDDAPEVISFEKSTENYVLNLDLSAEFKDTLSGLKKYKINKSSSYVNSGWITLSSATTSLKTYSLNIDENNDYYLWLEDDIGNYTSKKISVTNIDKEGPVFVSGGVVSLGSVTEANFSDVSTPIIVKYLIKTDSTTPSYNDFSSTSRTFSTSCGNTYYAYALAVDSLGNYTIQYLGNKNSDVCKTYVNACCDGSCLASTHEWPSRTYRYAGYFAGGSVSMLVVNYPAHICNELGYSYMCRCYY